MRYVYPGSGEGRVKLLCGRAGGCGLGGAPTPSDQTACEEAAEAGRRIHQLMVRDDDDRHLR